MIKDIVLEPGECFNNRSKIIDHDLDYWRLIDLDYLKQSFGDNDLVLNNLMWIMLCVTCG